MSKILTDHRRQRDLNKCQKAISLKKNKYYPDSCMRSGMSVLPCYLPGVTYIHSNTFLPQGRFEFETIFKLEI